MGDRSLQNLLPLTCAIPVYEIRLLFRYSNNHFGRPVVFKSWFYFCGCKRRAVLRLLLLLQVANFGNLQAELF